MRRFVKNWFASHRDKLRRNTLPGALLALSLLAFAVAGYFLTYHVFFWQLRLEEFATAQEGGRAETFRYDGVVYFDGTRLGAAETLELEFQSIPILDGADSKGIELFVRADGVEDLPPEAASAGSLRIVQAIPGPGRDETVEVEHVVELSADLLQRHVVPWVTARSRNRTCAFRVRFEPARADLLPDVVLSTNVTGARFTLPIALWTVLGVAALLLRTHLGRWASLPFLAVALPVLAVMAYFHSGAFISNEYFTTPGSSVVRVSTGAMKALEFGIHERMYRGLGYVFLPALTFLIEGPRDEYREFFTVFPTIRYLMFVWMAVSLLVLMRALHKYLGAGPAAVCGLLVATFYPFIVDCYNVCDDAYLIPLMMLFTAFLVRYAFQWRRSDRNLRSLGFVLFLMMTVKVTAIFLVPLVPAALLAAAWVNRERRLVRKALIAVLLLGVTAAGGRFVGKLRAREVVDGVPYARGVLWEVVWAASGTYDHYGAHDFTKSGPLRSQRVSERTGLPLRPSHLRHSQRATDEVYRPDVLNAMKERPGYFWAVAHLRFYNHAFSFFRYTYGGDARWEAWSRDGHRGKVIVSGREVDELTPERRLARHGRMWKISPLVLLTKFVQFNTGRLFDLVMLALALTGAFALRRAELTVFIAGCFLAKLAFGTLLHGMTRYMDFTHVALLVGLAVFLCAAFRAVRAFGPERQNAAG